MDIYDSETRRVYKRTRSNDRYSTIREIFESIFDLEFYLQVYNESQIFAFLFETQVVVSKYRNMMTISFYTCRIPFGVIWNNLGEKCYRIVHSKDF